MLKKLILGISSIVICSCSVFSMNVNNMNGAYYILKDSGQGDYSYETGVRLNKVENEERFSSTIKYKVESDSRYMVSEFEFVEIDGDTYASLKSGDNDTIYLVTNKTDFAITLKNIDNADDVIKIVYDKEYNDFEYDKFYENVKDLKDSDLKHELHAMIDNQIDLGYRGARHLFFTYLDNVDGTVTCVYTGKTVNTSGIPNSNIMNCEHTWPQSQFGNLSKDTKKDDVHHLFPTDSRANSKRGHVPLRNVSSVFWSDGGSVYGAGELGDTAFEPRDDHKGDVARAMFYFSVRYYMPIDEKQEQTFRQWHKEDPVSEKEMMRNAGIADAQKNRNPFIDRPDFVNNISDF